MTVRCAAAGLQLHKPFLLLPLLFSSWSTATGRAVGVPEGAAGAAGAAAVLGVNHLHLSPPAHFVIFLFGKFRRRRSGGVPAAALEIREAEEET